MHNELRKYWHPVARTVDVKGPTAVQLLDERIVLFRANHEIVALQDLCIHRGTALSLGWVENDEIICRYHGWQYDKTGACTRIPALPEGGHIPPKAKVPRYQAQQRYGLVWVCLDEPRHPIPEYPAYDDERWATVLHDDFSWKANAARMIENLLDYTHFPFVHTGLLGDRERPRYPAVEPDILDSGMSYQVDDERNGTIRHYRLWFPFTLDVTVRAKVNGDASRLTAGEKPRNYSMLFTCCPVSSKETIQWFFSSRDWNLSKPHDEDDAFDVFVQGQDQSVVESQRPEELPLDLTAELHLRGTDAATLNYRRMLANHGVDWYR